MKTTNILYWSTTGLFAAFMLMSGIQNAMLTPESKELINALGYPDYFIRFIGVAKILGAVAILVPSFRKIKEWAYAGLFFDLIGATYSILATQGFKPESLGMLIFFALAITSYMLNAKRDAMNGK